MKRVVIFTGSNPGPLLAFLPTTYITCILCETDVAIENLLTLSSTNKEYHLLTSQVGCDYQAWTSICSSKLLTVIIRPGYPFVQVSYSL